jgi:site-specific recombinase XerD
VQCVHCRTTFHNSCMGLDKFAYLGGWMECADCTLMQAKVNASVDDFTPAAEAAHRLVLLRSQQLAASTNSTYASGLHRFIDFGINVAKADLAQILPPKQEDQIPQKLVELFNSWANKKYKCSTIQTTLNALKAWHTSKQAGTDTVANPAITSLMTAVKNEQGPAGLPKGKEGMSKALLRIVLALLVEKSKADAQFAPLYTRDYAWMVLGYFGFLRRSELIELTMQDVQ